MAEWHIGQSEPGVTLSSVSTSEAEHWLYCRFIYNRGQAYFSALVPGVDINSE